MSKIVFDLDKEKIFFLVFCIFSFKKKSKKTFASGTGSKNVLKIFVYVHFKVTVKFSESLRQAKKQHFTMKFWNWGLITIWHNMKCVQFFSSKIIPP